VNVSIVTLEMNARIYRFLWFWSSAMVLSFYLALPALSSEIGQLPDFGVCYINLLIRVRNKKGS